MRDNIIIKSITESFKILPKSFKKRSILLMGGIVFNSILDLAGLATILPLVASVLQVNFIQETPLLKTAYDFTGLDSEKKFILLLCIVVLAFMILKTLLGVLIKKKQIQFSWDAYLVTSKEVLRSVFMKDYEFIQGVNSNVIQNRIVGVPVQFSSNVLLQLFNFINELLVLALSITIVVIVDYKIVLLLAIVVLPIFFAFYSKIKSKVFHLSKKVNNLYTELNKPVFEMFFGYTDVKINDVFSHFSKQYKTAVDRTAKARTKLTVFNEIPNRLIELCVILVVLVMVLYGVFVLENPKELIFILTVFSLAAYKCLPSSNRLMLSLMEIKGQSFNLELLKEYLPAPKRFEKKNLSFNQSVELSNVSFKFSEGDAPVLSYFNLVINKGEKIGVKGESGSGKTTLINLLLGFYHPQSGAITIDGVKRDKFNLQSWQSKCAYVNQSVFLLDGTIRENIAFGIDPDEVDDEKISQVIKKARLSDFVDKLPQKENSSIGERGAKISGGQRQRIGIARALYNDAEVIFFDEATSALDSKTEDEITESIESLSQEKKLTMIIIAHRESTLKHCDQIITLK